MPTPLRPLKSNNTDGGGPPESPEALFISALIEDGHFDPVKWKISDEDLACFQPLFRFCCDHQSRSGRGPTPSLIKRKFPYFDITPDVDPLWAATKLREASASRALRERMLAAAERLREEDLNGAYEALEGFMVPVGQRRNPKDAFDYALEIEESDEHKLAVPWQSLGRVTGGIAPSEVWLIGARQNQGKTTIAAGCYAAQAVKDGNKVIYFSMEMPARQIIRKVNMSLAAHDKKLFANLTSDEIGKRREALGVLKERTAGSFGVYDPSDGPVDPVAIRDALCECDLVIVDHMGLMKLGKRAAITDWRVYAEISNKVKEEALRSTSRVLGLVQINRAGESSSPLRVPKLSELGGTDALGQDADVVVNMNRFSDSVMLHSTEKVRLGPTARFYTEYLPAKGSFKEIKRDKATELAMNDEDARERAEG